MMYPMQSARPEPVATNDPKLWDKAGRILDISGCLVFPTDTVYGIAAKADDPVAVARLQQAKGRTDAFPPPVLVADAEAAWELVNPVPPIAKRLAEAFWPGPLTLVLNTDRRDLSLAGRNGSLGVRVPNLDWLRQFLRWSGPLAASSANRHNLPAATTVDDAIDQLGNSVGLYIDGGPTLGPAPSTVVDCTGEPTVRRVGRIPLQAILDITGGTDA